ncbi:MAG: class I SAM-dependent methyltransferase [bacterium]
MFSRSEYRRVIAWPERIKREAPFLHDVFGDAPARGLPRRLLDVGCGSGEHARHFAEQGWTAVGVDVSDSMIESAQEIAGDTSAGGSVRFELRDGATAGELSEAPFGGALFLGNGLAFVPTRDALDALFRGIARALAPGAPFLIQTLNYARIASGAQRAMPVNVRELPKEEGGGKVVLVRLFEPADGDREFVHFFPISLHVVPSETEGEAPRVDVRGAKQLRHRAWRRPDVESALTAAGFGDLSVFGGMRREPFDEATSSDLVVAARAVPA